MTRTRVAPLWAVGLMVAAVVAPGAAHVRRSATMTNLDTTPSVNSAEQRLKALGIELPMPPEPFGTYAEAVQTGNLVFLTGMPPVGGRRATFTGRIGAEIDVEGGRKAARLAALNALAVARQHLGSLDKVTRIVRLGVSVATTGDAKDQPKVADGASELLQQVFGIEKHPSRLDRKSTRLNSSHSQISYAVFC